MSDEGRSRPPALELSGVARSYRQGGRKLDVFGNVTLALARGEITALVGPSGAGKSSLLHIAGLLEAPDAGDVIVNGSSTTAMSDRVRSRVRRSTIGFVYQFHHLLPEFTALENVVVPLLIAGADRAAARERATALLNGFGLAERVGHRPGELSGGEQQRVAIARALANKPDVLLADEPTGNLDPKTADQVFVDLLAMARAEGLAALIATHNYDLAKRMDRAVMLVGGEIKPARFPD